MPMALRPTVCKKVRRSMEFCPWLPFLKGSGFLLRLLLRNCHPPQGLAALAPPRRGFHLRSDSTSHIKRCSSSTEAALLQYATPSTFLAHFENILLNVSFHLIVFNLHVACACGLVNAVALCPFLARARVCNLILGDHQVAGQRLNVEAVSFFRAAVVQYLVAAKTIPMPAVLESLFPEIDA